MKSQKATTQKLEKNDKLREDEKRRKNIIIEGLKEETWLHPRKQVASLWTDIGVTIPQENMPTVTRLGPIGVKGKRPRPILAKFSLYHYKQEVYKNIAKLKDNLKWKGTIIQDDLPQEEIAQRRDRKAKTSSGRY